MKGFICTIRNHRYQININKNELQEILNMNPDAILLDVRSQQEYNEGHLNGAILIPLDELNKMADEILKNKNALIIVYCRSGIRSEKAMSILNSKGYKNVYNLQGGIYS